MIHFIPAWYDPDRRWYSTGDASLRAAAAAAGVDDTVTRVRVFRQGSEEVGLVVLNYSPTLRRYLHGQGVFDVKYWSLFDELQGVEDDYTRPLDFLDLEWPDDVSFFYNPFLVTVMRGDEVYARVHLSRDGTLRSIRYFGSGMPTLERIYDDRGFLSSVLMHDDAGTPLTQYYLSPAGDVLLSEDVPSGRIEVVQSIGHRLQQQSYDGWESVIAELLGSYLQGRGASDTVVLTPAEQHNDLVAAALGEQTLVLSCSAGRPGAVPTGLLRRASAVFSDFGRSTSSDTAEQAEAWAELPVLSIYPLERKPTFGASANEAGVYLFLFADDITPDELDFAIATMATQLVEENTRLLVCTFRQHDLDHLQRIRHVIEGYQHLDLALLGDDENARLSVDVGIAEEPEEKIQLTFIDREADLIRTMAKSRVLVDLGARVNRRLAAEAVDAGVPQINRYEQELCTHPINGYAIADDSELGVALDWFLAGLEHWNQSLVQCSVLEDLFSASEVLTRWEFMKEGLAYASAADRP